MQDKIESDLKAALLSGDKKTADTLKNIKSAVMYEAVAKNIDRTRIEDDIFLMVLTREAKKRQEAADLYSSAGEAERASSELHEKEIISKYLPKQLTEEEIRGLVEKEVAKNPNAGPQDMGKIIGAVRSASAGAADGALIAKIVKEILG